MNVYFFLSFYLKNVAQLLGLMVTLIATFFSIIKKVNNLDEFINEKCF